MSAIATILLGLAGDLVAPMIKKILADKIGGIGGELAGDVIDTIAGKLGVPADEIPTIAAEDPGAVQQAIVATEAVTPELVLAYVESQRLMNETLRAEMDKGGPLWTWGWRPGWMWLLGLLWLYSVVLRPVVNAAIGASIEAVDLSTLMTLTGAYLALYMGGHTAKDIFGKKGV